MVKLFSKPFKVGRGHHCTPAERNIILKHYREGKSYSYIQNILGCSAKMISNAINYIAKVEKRGGKRKTTAQEDRRIVRFVKSKPFSSAKQVKEDLELQVSETTVRRRLREKSLYAHSPRKVPLLTKKHTAKRLQFANQHLNWPIEKWRNVLWTDESKIVLYGGTGSRQYVRRPSNTEFQQKYTIKSVKHGGAKVMVWGCFSYNGVGPIYKINGIMDQHIYVDILNNVMLPYANEDMPLKWVFQQDNDPKHTSHKAKEWFQVNGVEVMEWPAQSPDLNPIENLWGDVKKAVSTANPTNAQQLWEATQQGWYAIPAEKCQCLVDSMHRRCEAVISNKGFATKY